MSTNCFPCFFCDLCAEWEGSGTGKTRTIVAIVSSLLTGGQQSTNPSGKENQSRLNKSISTFPRQPRMKESAAMTRAWQDAALAREIGVTGNKGVGGSTDVQWGGPHKHRVLVCAQSNAAVDELVSRMCKNGLYGPDGNFFRPNLVRVGNIKTVHPDSLPVFIDTLIEERLGAEKQGEADALEEKTQKQSAMLRAKLEEVIENIQVQFLYLFLVASQFSLNRRDVSSSELRRGRCNTERIWNNLQKSSLTSNYMYVSAGFGGTPFSATERGERGRIWWPGRGQYNNNKRDGVLRSHFTIGSAETSSKDHQRRGDSRASKTQQSFPSAS